MSFAISRNKSKRTTASLNLVSLMDIFTILVFFLLMNSGDSQEIEKAKFVTLPESTSKTPSKSNLGITVSNDIVLIQGNEITTTGLLEKSDKTAIKAVKLALEEQVKKRPEMTDEEKKSGRAVTIMGDSAVPYAALKNIIKVCSETNHRDISLAVNQVLGTVAVAGGGE